MTEEKPERMAWMQTAGLAPWSWCMHHGNLGMGFDGGGNQVAQVGFTGVFAGAGGALHDHGAVALGGGFHDGLDLFQVVDVERRQAVAVFGGVVEKLAHGYEHGSSSFVGFKQVIA